VTRGRLFCAAILASASLAHAACRKPVPEEPQPAKGEMPVEQTPVSSLYEEKPGVLYERPQRTPSVSPLPAPTPSPTGRGKG
jgi:hypothetical protein